MKKPNSLRCFLLQALPELNNDPDRLLIFVDEGHIRSTMANGLSFEYSYHLKMILTNYASDLAAVTIPVLDWVRVNQSELMVNLAKVHDGIRFEAEILANDKVDLVIELPLTERVIVKRDENQLNVSYPEEPQYLKAFSQQQVSLKSSTGETIASWVSGDPEENYSIDHLYPGP